MDDHMVLKESKSTIVATLQGANQSNI